MNTNPFVGFKPYQELNANNFHGRAKDVQSLLEIIQKNRLTAIIGAKGSGKSSLINAGLIPRLKQGFLGQGGNQWAICKFRPGISPIENLAYALVSDGVMTDDGKANTNDFKSYLQTLRDYEQLGIVEIYKNSEILNKKNLLIVVDQLEDLFRFKRHFDANIENEDNLLLDIIARTVQVKEVPIYFLFALRSNYTDKISEYIRLQEIISQSMYSIRNIDRQGIQEIIEKHFNSNNIYFDSKAREQIENVVLADATKLQYMQYLMFRLFEKGQQKLNETGSAKINQNWIDELGGINNNIRKGLQLFYDNLSTTDKSNFEKIHRALMNFQDDNDLELYATIGSISRFTNSTPYQINQLLQKINSTLGGFYELIPPLITNIEVNENKIPDKKSIFVPNFSSNIKWKLIEDWSNDEEKNYNVFVDLEKDFKKFKLGQGSYLIPPALDLAKSWKEKKEVNTTWARKYNLDFKGTIQYIDESFNIFQDNINAEELRKKTVQRFRRLVLISIIILLIGSTVFGIIQYRSQKQITEKNNELRSKENTLTTTLQKLRIEKDSNIVLIQNLQDKEFKLTQTNQSLEDKRIQLNASNLELERSVNKLREDEKIITEKRDSIQKLAEDNLEQKKQEERNKKYAYKLTKFSELKRNLLYEIQSLDLISEKQKIIDSINEGLIEYDEFKALSKILGKTEEPFEVYDWLQTALMILNDKKDFVETSLNQNKKDNASSIRSVALDEKNNVFFGGDNGTLIKYDSAKGTTQNIFTLNNDRIRKVFIADGVYVGTFRGEVYKINLNASYTNTPNKIPLGDVTIGPIRNLFKSKKNGNLVVVGDNGIFEKSTNGKSFLSTPIHASFYDGEQLYFSHKDKIYLFDNQKKTAFFLQNNENDGNDISAIAVGNGKIFLGTESGLIYVYEKPQSGSSRKALNFIERINIHKSKITSLLYTEKEKLLFSASLDNQIFKYSLENKINKPLRLVGHDQWVWDLDLFTTYDKSGNINLKLVSADENGNLISWYVNQDDLANKVKEKANASN